MRLLIFSFTFLLASPVCFAQNGAHTATKVNAISSFSIPLGSFEFEPNFYSSAQSEAWNNNGELLHSYPADSVSIESGLAFRINYSPLTNMEVASVIPSDVSSAYIGVKYVFLDSTFVKLNSFIGSNLILGNRFNSPSVEVIEDGNTLGLGVGASMEFSEQTNLDISAEYQMTRPFDDRNLSDFFLFADFGYYPWEGILLFNSFGYQKHFPELYKSYTFSIYPGFTLERGSQFIIQLNGQFDLAGQNALKTYGFNMALTMMLN